MDGMRRLRRKSRLSWYKQERLIEHFVAGTTARTAARLVGVHRNTAAYYFHRLREIIAYELEKESEELLAGEIEADESYFGGGRKGKRGRGAAGKVPVFRLLKRGGRVNVKIIEDASGKTLMVGHSPQDRARRHRLYGLLEGYDVLDVSDFHHVRINHSELFAEGRNHINGIENFWSQAKRICAVSMAFRGRISGCF